MTQVRVAVAGLGNAAMNLHLPALATVAQATLVGGCDPSESARSSAAAKYAMRTFATLGELMAAVSPDVVIVCAPPRFHHAACLEALDLLAQEGIVVDFMRVRGYPFADEVGAFLEAHEMNFVVEQNRDAQLRSLLTLDTGVPLDKLESVRYYGGFPLSAHHVISGVKAKLEKAA